MGEIDYNIGLACIFARFGINGKRAVGFGIDIKTGDNFAVFILITEAVDRFSHPAVAAGNNYLQHFPTSFL